MNPFLVAPVAIALLALATGWFLPRFAHPAVCVRVLVGTVGLAAAAILAALLQIVLASLGEVSTLAAAITWCSAVYGDNHGGSLIAGIGAFAALVVGGVRVVQRRREYRTEVATWSGSSGVQVVDTPGPVAFAVPGEPGAVVVSAGLLNALDVDERRAVLAHERAHLRDRHHRYLRFVDSCAAAFPILVPMAGRVRFATERWADERAADEIGSRRVVARAVARVGLLRYDSDAEPAMGFGGGPVPARVDALLGPAPDQHGFIPLAACVLASFGVVAGSSVQIHHLVALARHLCGY